jgi:phytol kinase
MSIYLAVIVTFGVALGFLRGMDFAAQRGWIESRLSRKLIHIGTGPIFVLCWLLFKDEPGARWLAMLVPLAITLQFALVGLGVIKDEAAIQAMSRSGDPKEILRGPLYYGITFVVLTLVYWKDSPIGISALMIMCGGDGIADLIGRGISSPRLPWSREKSVAGSLAVFLGGWILSTLVIWFYTAGGVFPGPLGNYVFPITVVTLAAMLVESLPFKDIDNLTVTLVAVLVGHLVF